MKFSVKKYAGMGKLPILVDQHLVLLFIWMNHYMIWIIYIFTLVAMLQPVYFLLYSCIELSEILNFCYRCTSVLLYQKILSLVKTSLVHLLVVAVNEIFAAAFSIRSFLKLNCFTWFYFTIYIAEPPCLLYVLCKLYFLVFMSHRWADILLFACDIMNLGLTYIE